MKVNKSLHYNAVFMKIICIIVLFHTYRLLYWHPYGTALAAQSCLLPMSAKTDF